MPMPCLALALSLSMMLLSFFFSSRRRHTRFDCDWSSDVCSSDLEFLQAALAARRTADERRIRDLLHDLGVELTGLAFVFVERHRCCLQGCCEDYNERGQHPRPATRR